MARPYSKLIKDTIDEFLKADDWRYRFDEDEGIFRMGITLKSTLKHADIYIKARADDLYVITVLPIGADEKTKAAVAELITRINYALIVGKFEMDYSDGEIRCSTYLMVNDSIPTLSQIKDILYLISEFLLQELS